MARILDQNTVDQLTLADGQFIFDSEPSLRGFGVRLRIDAKGRLAKAYFVAWKNSDGSQRRRVIGNAARMPAQALDPNQVLRFKEWIKLAGISPATGWKLLHSGEGPKFLRIGEKRVGIRVLDHIKWIERLTRAR